MITPARADYALLQDGRALFNVRVVDTDTTQSRPLRVVFRPESFGYDYQANSPFLLRGRSDVFNLADYVTTSSVVGKSGAREWMEEKKWSRYTAPPRPLIPRITPAPPTPVPTPPRDEVPPSSVADSQLPIEQRIQLQLDMFIREQTTLAEQLKLISKAGNLDPERAKKARLDLLARQIRVLEKHYPGNEELVVQAKEALQHHVEFVQEKGRFNFED